MILPLPALADESRIPPKTTSEEKGGPSAKLRAKGEAHEALVKTNSETFRISNDGRFPTRVSLAFEDQVKLFVTYVCAFVTFSSSLAACGTSVDTGVHPCPIFFSATALKKMCAWGSALPELHFRRM